MKKIILYTMLAALTFPLVVKAEDVAIPIISKPALLDEGTQKELTSAQIAELLPWAKDSKIFLNDMLEGIQGLSTTDKIDRLVEGIRSVVEQSGPKNSELLMRYALNRGLAISEIISKETKADAVGTADAKIRVLIASANMAIRYYDTDMEILTKKTAAPFVTFGFDYFNFLNELNKSIFDASAQYAISRTALEWLQWDLYRDLNNATYAPQIVKINNNLKLFPTQKLTDAQSIAYIRQMKKISEQLGPANKPVVKPVPPKQEGPAPTTSKVIKKGALMVQTVDDNHYHVLVKEIYRDGLVDVEYLDPKYKGNKGTIPLSSLSFSLEVLGNLRINTAAVQTTDGKHYHLIIKEIFADKMVLVEYTDPQYKGNTGTISYKYISYSLNELREFRVGQNAIQTSNGSHYHVIIREIFADGLMEVEYTDPQYKGNRGTIHPSLLSLPIED